MPSEKHIEPNSVCVMDDLLTESESSKEVTNMCTRIAHHKLLHHIDYTKSVSI